MTGELYINGIDAYTAYGASLEDGSYEKLLGTLSVKPLITNESSEIDGTQVLLKPLKVEAREFTVVFVISSNANSFLSNYNSFISALKAGKTVNNKLYPLEINVTALSMTFKVVFQGCVSLDNANLKFGKLAVKFFEPNPASR